MTNHAQHVIIIKFCTIAINYSLVGVYIYLEKTADNKAAPNYKIGWAVYLYLVYYGIKFELNKTRVFNNGY